MYLFKNAKLTTLGKHACSTCGKGIFLVQTQQLSLSVKVTMDSSLVATHWWSGTETHVWNLLLMLRESGTLHPYKTLSLRTLRMLRRHRRPGTQPRDHRFDARSINRETD